MSKAERDRLRRERLEAQGEQKQSERRARTMKLAGAIGLAAVLAVVVLVVVSQSGDKGGDTDISGGGKELPELAGLTQSGDEIGDANAPVTIIEYGDLQCPVCRQFSQEVVPDILQGPVADGDATMRFRTWVILGPDSETAAKGALSAGEQDKLWDFVELFYANQGPENTGYVTDEFMRAIAEQIPGLDVEQWDADLPDDAFDAELADIDTEAQEAGATGTPTVVVSGPAGNETLEGVPDAAAIKAAVTRAQG